MLCLTLTHSVTLKYPLFYSAPFDKEDANWEWPLVKFNLRPSTDSVFVRGGLKVRSSSGVEGGSLKLFICVFRVEIQLCNSFNRSLSPRRWWCWRCSWVSDSESDLSPSDLLSLVREETLVRSRISSFSARSSWFFNFKAEIICERSNIR